MQGNRNSAYTLSTYCCSEIDHHIVSLYTTPTNITAQQAIHRRECQKIILNVSDACYLSGLFKSINLAFLDIRMWVQALIKPMLCHRAPSTAMLCLNSKLTFPIA